MGIERLLLAGKTVKARIADAHLGSEEVWSLDDADHFTVDLDDTDRTLLRSGLFSERVTLDTGKIIYELAGVTKSLHTLQLLFEDAAVAQLRAESGVLTVDAGRITRTQFAERLTKQVGGLRFKGQPGSPRKMASTRGDGENNDSWETLGSLASDRNWRRYLHRRTMWFGSDEWLFKQHEPVRLSESRRGVENIDVQYLINRRNPRSGRREATATVTARASRWPLPPATPIILEDMGVADGRWLVASRRKPTDDDLCTIDLVRRQPSLPEPRHEPDPEFDPGDLSQAGQTSVSGGGSAQVEAMVGFAMGKNGGPYVWGGNGPSGYDCSGLTTAAARVAGVTLPRTSKTQYAHCRDRGRLLSVDNAINLRGALLFRMTGEPTHVALSLGNGQTIEARGRAYGIGVFSAHGRGWTSGGAVPGVTY